MATVGYTGARHDAENGITEPITPSPLTAVRPSRARRPGEAAVKGVLTRIFGAAIRGFLEGCRGQVFAIAPLRV